MSTGSRRTGSVRQIQVYTSAPARETVAEGCARLADGVRNMSYAAQLLQQVKLPDDYIDEGARKPELQPLPRGAGPVTPRGGPGRFTQPSRRVALFAPLLVTLDLWGGHPAWPG